MNHARLMLRRDLPDAIETLTAGFFEDPIFSWVFPDADRRRSQLSDWFGLVARFSFEHGHCYRLPANEAIALWVPPDIDLVDEAQRGELVGLLTSHMGEEHAMTVARGFGAAGAHHPEAPPSFQLWYVAAEASQRNRGNGRRVLQPVLDRLESDGLAAYLHSTNERNVPFYERLGFSVIAEVPMPGGPAIRPMWRPAP